MPLVTAVDDARFEVLLESIHADVRAIAVAQAALIERFDAWRDCLEGRFERVSTRLVAIDAKVTAIDGKLDRFSDDTQARLKRIEARISLDGPLGPKTRRQREAPRRG